MTKTDIATKSTVAQVVEKLDALVGSTNEEDFKKIVAASSNFEEFQNNVETILGSSDFVSFARINHTRWTEIAGHKTDCFLYVLGNPLLAKVMLDESPLAGQYVPTRLLVYLHEDGFAHITFDSLEDTLAFIGNEKAAAGARIVDEKLLALANACAK